MTLLEGCHELLAACALSDGRQVEPSATAHRFGPLCVSEDALRQVFAPEGCSRDGWQIPNKVDVVWMLRLLLSFGADLPKSMGQKSKLKHP